MEALAVLGRAVVVLALTLGMPLVLLTLLNVRDRRQARLLSTVLDQTGSRDLRGSIAVQVRCGVLSRRSVVRVHIVACAPNAVWDIITRLSERLPPQVRLQVTAPVDRHGFATFTVRTIGRHPLPGPSRPSFATG